MIKGSFRQKRHGAGMMILVKISIRQRGKENIWKERCAEGWSEMWKRVLHSKKWNRVNETFKISGSFQIKQPTKTWIEVTRGEQKVNKDQANITNACK